MLFQYLKIGPLAAAESIAVLLVCVHNQSPFYSLYTLFREYVHS